MSILQIIKSKLCSLFSIMTSVVLIGGGIFILSLIVPKVALADSDTYSWSNATTLDQTTYDWGYHPCPSNDTGCMSIPYTLSGVTYGEADPWLYNLRNCTSYVAEKVNQEFGVNVSGWGNAASWATNAQNGGYSLDSSPEVGDIAVWGTEVGGGYGHVAYIYGLDGSGNGELDEYNVVNPGQFSTTRTTASGSAGAADWYIHMGTPGGGGGGGTAGLKAPSVIEDSGTGRNVFFVGADNEVHQWTVVSGSWSEFTIGGTVEAGTTISAVEDTSGSGRNVFYVDNNDTLHQWYVSNGSWTNTNLNISVKAGTSPSAIYDSSSGRNIFYVASSGVISQLYVSNGSWTTTTLGGTAATDSSPSAVDDTYGGTGRNIFYVASNGINQYYVSNGAWTNTTLGGTVESNTSPSAMVDSYNGTGRNIFYFDSNDTLHQYYVSSGSWTNTSIGGTAQSGTSPYSLDDSVSGTGRNIFYVSSSGSINQYYVSSGSWTNTNLGGEGADSDTSAGGVDDSSAGRDIFYYSGGHVWDWVVQSGSWSNGEL